MRSLLRKLPEGAGVIVRTTHEGVVECVWGGDHGRRLFDARVGLADCHYDSSLIAAPDRPLLVRGARFWLLQERVRLCDGVVVGCWEIRFMRPGITSAAQAFPDRAEAADV